MGQEAEQLEQEFGSAFVGGDENFDEPMSAEDQALHDAEMNDAVDEAPEAPALEAVAPVAEPEPAITQEDVDEVAALEPNAGSEAEAGIELAADPEPAPEPAVAGNIPKARLDREIQKRRELEQQLQALQAGKRVEEVVAEDKPIEVQIDAEAITRALDMNLDGKNTEAAGLLIEQMQNAVSNAVTQTKTQMREELKASTDAAVSTAVGQVSAQANQTTYEATVAQIETDYPIFNPDVEGFNPELASRAGNMRDALVRDGLSQAEALTEAVEITLGRYAPEHLKQPVAAAEAGQAPAGQTARERKRNIDAANAQPSRVAGTPNATEDAGRIDLDKLTDEEFDALPESTIAELRGDTL
jgi:hypothetical protein